MNKTDTRLTDRLTALLNAWSQDRPGRATLHAAADELLSWRRAKRVPGLWPHPPRMLGATLDDGWGYGIELILKFAEVLGCDTKFLGVLCPIDTIVEACEKGAPDILGLTVLQLDTEELLIRLRKELQRKCHPRPTLVAGGPVFAIDPELPPRVGIDFVAKDAAHFIRYMLENMN